MALINDFRNSNDNFHLMNSLLVGGKAYAEEKNIILP
jgi:hypothetical protein